MVHNIPSVLVDFQYLAAGFALQICVAFALVWRRERELTHFVWLAGCSATLGVALLANVWVLHAGINQIHVAVTVRSIVLTLATLTFVPALAAISGQPLPRPWYGLLVALGGVRLLLWLTTDLIYTYSIDADGTPAYGPLRDLTTATYFALLVILALRLAAGWSDRHERAAFVSAGGLSLLMAMATVAPVEPTLAELLAGYWVLPSIVGLEVIASLRSGRAQREDMDGRRRQEELTTELVRVNHLSHLAMAAGRMGWYEFDPVDRALIRSSELDSMLGLRPADGPSTIDAVASFLHTEDRAAFLDAVAPGQAMTSHRGEFRWVVGRSAPMWIEASADTFEERGVGRVVGILKDVSERKRAESRLMFRLRTDALTGLPNREAFVGAVGRALEQPYGRLTLLVVDVDSFRHVNEMLGHAVGDRVLVALAQRLRTGLGEVDALARLGGNEFAVLGRASSEVPSVLADDVLAALARPVDVDGIPIFVRVSIGVVEAPDDGTDADTLLRRAEAAMFEAKSRGGTWQRFDRHAESAAAGRLRLATELPKALATNQLELHYQPTLHLLSGTSRTLEALVRWRHAELGLIPPSQFVDLAEDRGLGLDLFRWVMDEALSQCARWRAVGLADSVAVNISPGVIVEPRVVEIVASALAGAGLPSSALILEITENAFANSTPEMRGVLAAFNQLGVSLAIDDFGTGYSSLAYLKRLPVRSVKLDQAFTKDLASDAANDAIVSLVIELAHRLGLIVVAEGVECEETLTALAVHGCDVAQGYWICRPLPADDITEWLEQRSVV